MTVRDSSQRPYSACSRTACLAWAFDVWRSNVRTRYSYSVIAVHSDTNRDPSETVCAAWRSRDRGTVAGSAWSDPGVQGPRGKQGNWMAQRGVKGPEGEQG